MDRKIPVLFKEKKECCGCTACYAICSQMAIVVDLINYQNTDLLACL